MINTSNEYNYYFENVSLLGRLNLEVQLSIEDNQFKNNSTLESSNEEYYSDKDYLYQDQRDNYNYATLENNFWILNGSQPMIEDTDYTSQKMYISNSISDSNGDFAVEDVPTLTYTAEDLSYTYNSIGLTFTFDDINGNYPNSITIETYNGDTLIDSDTVTNISSPQYVYENPLTNYNKLVISFLDTNNPIRRIRLNDIVFGVIKVYKSKDIIEASGEEKVDSLSREISVKNFSFTIDNNDLSYNAENPVGINKFLQEKQEISVKFKDEISDNNYETINYGKYLLDGKPIVEERKATFNAYGYNYFGYNKFYKYNYTNTPTSFKSIAELILGDMDIPLDAEGNNRYYVDDSLASMYCNVPLPLENHNELLKLIAQACYCVVRETKDGYIRIEPNSIIDNDVSIDFKQQSVEPTSELTTNINEIDVKKYSATVDTSSSELYKGSYTINGTQEIHIEYNDSATNSSAVMPSGFTLVSATYYTHACDLTVSTTSETTGEIKINGYKISTASTIISAKTLNGAGEIGEIDNQLVSDDTVASNLATNWLAYSQKRNKYNIQCKNKYDLRIEANDLIQIETQFNSTVNVRVNSIEYEYNGGIGGKFECKSLDS